MSIDFPKEEEIVLEKWRELDAFHRQVSCLILPRKIALQETDRSCTA